MGVARHTILLLSVLFSVLTYALGDHSFENEAIVRTIELGGAVVRTKTTYAVKALDSASSIYVFALDADQHEKLAGMEAKIRGGERLVLQNYGFNAGSNTYLYVADLPKPLKKEEKTTLELETILTHATYPWPPTITQTDKQALKFETDLFVLSPYTTLVQRTKIRTPSPNVLSYTEPKDVDAFTLDAPVTKSGATITYGPYNNVSGSTNKDFVADNQKRITVHYAYDLPLLEIPTMKRAAEISHWGSNLNIEDKIHLYNAGAKLKGHFSRIEHMRQVHMQGASGHVMKAINVQLPPGIRDVYYYDLIGNVSTSRLRVAPSVPRGAIPQQYSLLEMRPRYPIVGGWNYSFTLGWDSPLRDSVSYDSKEGKYTVAVPLMTHFQDVIVDGHEFSITFPEGATDIQVFPPFKPAGQSESVLETFLDSIGRPVITLKYAQLTEANMGTVYATYKVPFTAHLRKPVTITAVFSVIFVAAGIIRRLDTRIHKKY